VSRDQQHRDKPGRDQGAAENELTPEAAQTDHPTGEDQAAANVEEEPAG
jgi:hypothetical protein